MTPEQRAAVLAEELPTGSFGDGPATASSTAALRPRREPSGPDPLAAVHRAQLLAALTGTEDPRAVRRRTRLRLVPGDERAAS